ncbi:MAG: hypothetical protein MJ222_00505 [Bacilli bacterium]|nr:hypothetical protein [Bacilli bacterium]
MEQIKKIRKCYSCGATLQCDDPSKEGYVNKEVLENPTQNFLFCNRCFEAERFSSVSNEPYIDEEFIEVIKQAKEKGCLIVYVVNLFSFETSFSKELTELISGGNILVVGTKFDLLPEGTSLYDTSEYVAHRFRVAGLKIKSEDVMITTKQDDDSIQETLTRIFELKNGKDVFIIGQSDSGKTALISAFLKIYSNLSNGNIMTHEYKSTNLKVMEIPLNNRSSMYETPGISITNSILFGLDAKTLKSIYLTKPVKAREMSISEHQSLFIGGLGIIEVLEGDKATFTCYFHDNVQLRKSHITDVEKKFISLNSKGQLNPSLNRIKSTKDMEIFDITFQNKKPIARDIGFAGLGWVTINSTNQKLRIYVPKGVAIYTSRPKVKND